MRASPVGQPPRVRHSASNCGPAARWIAPSTPPPPSNELFAALTIASTSSLVMSVRVSSIRSSVLMFPSFDQHAFPFRDANDRLRAGVEFQKIIFDAVAKNHAVFGHARFEDERGFLSDATEYQRHACRICWERFAHGVE